jgi:nucleoid DNA-binding protein
MRKSQRIILIALVGGLAVLLTVARPALSQKPPEAPKTLKGRIVSATKLQDADVQKMLTALGPAIRDHLSSGAQVELPGLGTFRVVRVPEHRDLVSGRPATVAATNNVEFLPAGDVVNAANSARAVPAETVPPFEYLVNPNHAPSTRIGTTRQTGTRTR